MKTVRSQFGSINRIVHNHFITPHRSISKMATRDQNVEFAKLALVADRFDDMMEYMEAAAAAYTCELSPEEVCGFRFATPTEDQLSF